MDAKIGEVEQEIRKVQKQIDVLEEELTRATNDDDVAYWRKEKEQLRKEKEQLRKEKEQLRKEKEQLRKKEEQLREEKLLLLKADTSEGFSHSKKSRIDGRPTVQSFAQSAAKHYRQWEQAEKAGVENGGHKNFLVVSEDPFNTYPEGFVVWIRKCYRDLKEILSKAAKSGRFVLLGTAGIGKSVFTLFWICYRATLKEKVVWKFLEDEWYLLGLRKFNNPHSTCQP